MKIAIMQPYLFPYIGYYQLINTVDKFVLLNTVQFVRHGWIERNRVLKQTEDWGLYKSSIKKTRQKYINLENIPTASKITEQVLCLPLYSDLKNEDIERITNIINE